MNEMKQEIIALIEKIDDPRALRAIYSYLSGFLVDSTANNNSSYYSI